MERSRLGLLDLLLALIVLTVAAGVRFGYVMAYCDDLTQPPPVQVQDAETMVTLVRSGDWRPTDRDVLVDNLRQYNWFASRPPLADLDEETAHVAPGYPWLIASLADWMGDAETATRVIRWAQCGLGALTAFLYCLFARLAFGSTLVGFLAGLLTALHPFWVVNVAELQDGTLAGFLLACCLFLGTAAAQRGNVLGSFLFGGSLAGLVLVRAALMPFAFLACLWFLMRCRVAPRGWVCALLAFLGFANGLAPWTVRNYRSFGDVLPITDSMYLHLWMGSNSRARGGPQDDATVRATLPPERLKKLLAEPNQARRYGMLAEDVRSVVAENPAGVIEKRLRAAVCFVFGAAWFQEYTLTREVRAASMPAALAERLPLALRVSLLLMLALGVLGWRWSFGWNREANLGSLALIWIPLPYVLSHADFFCGPRLPLDGVILTFAAFALAWMFPPVARVVFPEPDE
jgi:hypothetical protein